MIFSGIVFVAADIQSSFWGSIAILTMWIFGILGIIATYKDSRGITIFFIEKKVELVGRWKGIDKRTYALVAGLREEFAVDSEGGVTKEKRLLIELECLIFAVINQDVRENDGGYSSLGDALIRRANQSIFWRGRNN